MAASENHIPRGFSTVTPYLTVKGAPQLLDFVKRVFDAEELMCEYKPGGLVAHAAVKIGDSIIEISDATEEWGATPAALHVYVPDTDAVYQRAIEAGGTSLHEPVDQFYGERSGAVRDMCGNNWYIATHLEDLTEEEIARRAEAMYKQ